MKTTLPIYLAQFFLEWEVFQAKVVEKLETHTVCSITVFQKSRRLWDNVEKCCRAGQATDDNVAHAHCMLNTGGYKHTLTICNTYCFSTATMVPRSRLSVTLYLHFLSSVILYSLGTRFDSRPGRKICHWIFSWPAPLVEHIQNCCCVLRVTAQEPV
jgi:hypothetical protein